MPEPTLAEIAQQIDMFEAAGNFAAELEQFTDFLTSESGGNVTKWLSDDKSVQFELDQLKNAALKFSETLQAGAKIAEPLTTAASTAGNINTAVKTVLTFAEAVDQADQSSGAEKATQLADVISGMTNIAQVLTGLSLNPVIGAFIGLYAVALQNAAIGLATMEAYAARRNEMINSRGGEFDLEAAIAEQQAAAEQAEDAQLELARQLDALYTKRGELIAGLQAGQYRVALDYCASRNGDALKGLISAASEHGGIVGNATPNGDSLERVEEIVSELAGASFDLMMQAAAAPEGSEARAELVERAEDLLDTKRDLTEGLGPFRDCVTDALERYGYSTADAGSANNWFGAPRRVVLGGGGGIFALAMVGLVFLFSGGSESGPWSVTDPRNDFVPTFSGGEAIENPASAGDVTHMEVAVSGGNTTVTVTFAGDAQALHAEGGEELAAALQFIPVGNERFIDMLFKEDGETKISDPPSGSRITSNWTAPNTLVFEITGVTPAKGATVRFATIQRLRSGHSTDEVLLSTGDEGSSLVTPEPVNAPSTRAPAPLVIQPCDVIDPTLAASIAGTTTEPTVSGTDRFQTCDYPGPAGASEGTGIRLIMAVTRNSAGGILDTYRSNNDGAVETRSVVWSDEGEMWIHIEGTDFSKVELLAFVDIPGSRRIYVTVTMFGPAGSAASMATAAETISALLNEAVLAAQP